MRGILFCFLAVFATVLTGNSVVGQDETQASTPPQNSIWFEQRVGHAIVSVAVSNGQLQGDLAYVFYLAAIGPRPATVTRDYGGCLKEAVREAGLSFIQALDQEAGLFVPTIQPIYADAQVTRTQNALVTARGKFRQAVVSICSSIGQTDPLRAYIDGARLALVKRECISSLCPGLVVPARAEKDGNISEGERRQRVFEAIYYWALKKGVDAALNQPILLEYSDSGGLAARGLEVLPATHWPPRLAQTSLQEHFERGVARVVNNPDFSPLSSVVAAQLALPRQTVLRTALAFQNPQDAWYLGIDAAELKLEKLQDEVARIRLTECKVFRGQNDFAEVARCAGYQVDDVGILECINGGPCMPTIIASADAGAILQSARRQIADLSLDALVPRPYSDAVGSFEAMVATYKSCAARPEAGDTAACLARQIVPPEIAGQADCLLNETGVDRVACLVPDGAAKRALLQIEECTRQRSWGCAAEAALPPEWACIAHAESVADASCLAESAGGDVGRVAACLAQHSDVAGRITCIAGNQIPPTVRQVIDCYRSSQTEAGLAACALSTALPPEQAAAIKCAAESGGDVMAAGVCMAAPLLGLNPGQQIILQCAASSGGVPVTAAACIVGRFTLAELQGCKTAEFGKSGCFGDGNEFQKLAKLVTGSTMSKDSVVGQVVIAHVEVANATISGAGHALGQLSNGAESTVNGIGHELEVIREKPLEALANAPGNIAREGAKGLENLGRALDPSNWSW